MAQPMVEPPRGKETKHLSPSRHICFCLCDQGHRLGTKFESTQISGDLAEYTPRRHFVAWGERDSCSVSVPLLLILDEIVVRNDDGF